MPLLVSAYPDLKPKVVRGALLGATRSITSSPPDTDLHQRRTSYYRYLSLLLDADEGVDSARSDGRLVEVSCLWSIDTGRGRGRAQASTFIFLPRPLTHSFVSSCLQSPSMHAMHIFQFNNRRNGATYRLSCTRNLLVVVPQVQVRWNLNRFSTTFAPWLRGPRQE